MSPLREKKSLFCGCARLWWSGFLFPFPFFLFSRRTCGVKQDTGREAPSWQVDSLIPVTLNYVGNFHRHAQSRTERVSHMPRKPADIFFSFPLPLPTATTTIPTPPDLPPPIAEIQIHVPATAACLNQPEFMGQICQARMLSLMDLINDDGWALFFFGWGGEIESMCQHGGDLHSRLLIAKAAKTGAVTCRCALDHDRSMGKRPSWIETKGRRESRKEAIIISRLWCLEGTHAGRELPDQKSGCCLENMMELFVQSQEQKTLHVSKIKTKTSLRLLCTSTCGAFM